MFYNKYYAKVIKIQKVPIPIQTQIMGEFGSAF